MASSVSEASRICLTNLASIWAAASQPDKHSEALSRDQIRDTMERFSLWGGNIGALHPPGSPLSLETRLHEANDVLSYILDVLKELNEAVDELSDIVAGRREGSVASGGVGEDQYEVAELLEEVSTAMTQLSNASTLIRQVAPVDLFQKALSRDRYRFNNQYDIAYVGEKYPKLAADSSVRLRKRLGEAITRRRHYLSYIQDHREKLDASMQKADNVAFVPQQPEMKSPIDRTKVVDLPTDTASRPDTFFTEVTTRVQSGVISPHMLLGDSKANVEEDAKSCTTVAHSVDEDFRSSATVKIPRLKELQKGSTNEIECPFCFRIKKFRSEGQWRRHVFSDLRAYVCTFPDCDVAYFDDMNEWFQHEMQAYRVSYICRICHGKHFERQGPYLAHIQREHPLVFESTEEKSLLDIARQPMLQIPAQDCPCCSEWEGRVRDRAVSTLTDPSTSDEVICVQPRDFKHHLASHLEHLALFAAPIPSVYLGDDASNAAIQQASSVGSDDVARLQRNARLVTMDVEHDVFDSSNPKPFTLIGTLGRGATTEVIKVICTLDSEEYALKHIQLSRSRRIRQITERLVRNEIAILKRLKHNHVVPYLGSFVEKTRPNHESLYILFPVADMNLERYLEEITPSQLPELRSYFGCLTTTLKYLHDQKIRHSDIKPSNILVNHGKVLLSGFSLALDFTEKKLDEYGTTELVFESPSWYSAPEVIGQKLNSTQSDIWSLGAVFFRMFAALKGKAFDDVTGGYLTLHSIIDYLPTHLEALRGIGDATDNLLMDYIQPMLSRDRSLRPNVSTLAEQMTRAGEEETNPFCGACCISYNQDLSD